VVLKLIHISRWYCHYKNIPGTSAIHPTINFAIKKLQPPSEDPKISKLAALDCRIILRFDPLQRNSHDIQAKLVKSYMKVVYNIPETRGFMACGYPSEPILAEAAARLLNEGSHVKKLAPQILSQFDSDLVAKGERGELVTRTLFTVAHDMAIMEKYPDPAEQGLRFHRPIKLLDLLRHLIAPNHWDTVRNAKPSLTFDDDLTLEEAYKDAWVNFSHYVELGNHESFELANFPALLKRGAAIQTYDCQYNMDSALPTLFGDENTPIEVPNIGPTLIQTKNRKKTETVFPDPNVISECKTLPVLSIIMELGVEPDKSHPPVRVHSESRKGENVSTHTRYASKSLPSDIRRRHYVLTFHGCTSKTYGCIPENSEEYTHLLRARSPFDDFPRNNDKIFKGNSELFKQLRPMVDSQVMKNWV